MATIFNTFLYLLDYVWNYRRNQKFKKINKLLKETVIDQDKERKIFLNEFRFYLRKYLRKDASGKYIPLRGKNNAEIYAAVVKAHGDRMKELNIKFTPNLEIQL